MDDARCEGFPVHQESLRLGYLTIMDFSAASPCAGGYKLLVGSKKGKSNLITIYSFFEYTFPLETYPKSTSK